jgi:hypothetical protein
MAGTSFITAAKIYTLKGGDEWSRSRDWIFPELGEPQGRQKYETTGYQFEAPSIGRAAIRQ